jgi:anti-sigma regulatory factor (Ser/Thr protein kinase)
MRPLWTYELEPDLAAVRAAALEFRNWASNHANKAAVTDCELALVEACNNLVQHNSSKEAIKLNAEADLEELRILIWDRTNGFDWPPNPQLPETDSEHGRGLYLINMLMTAVEYTRSGGWNELRLRRRL